MDQPTQSARYVSFFKETGISVQEGQTLLVAAMAAGIPIFHVCGGNAQCSTCRVLVMEGSESLSGPTENEYKLRQKMHFPQDVRLACQTTVQKGMVTVRRIIQDEHDIRLYVGTNTNNSVQQVGEEKDQALFFLDIRNFTRFVQTQLPFDIIHIIRKLFSVFQTNIDKGHGRIIETAGDGLYAVFGCSDGRSMSANNAVQSALSIINELEELNKNYFGPYFGEPVEVGIGIHIGKVISGTIILNENEHPVVMGFPVNTASRLQNATKELNNSLVVSSEINELLAMEVKSHQPLYIQVKGVNETLTVYKLGKPFTS